ncbi:MAG: T9SS type A sorting domain-containing protein [Saprospiraceae bacterium]|nr:T9SS type A sorting domain-containing protein [Saprospiraceae bacterium]
MIHSRFLFPCLLLCWLGVMPFAAAQDTLVVQTLTLDSDARSGVFEFPSDDAQQYEKILMRYRMRCHDAAVGNGNVGCREWDYSCNTFITDSTQVDSNRALHPDFIISNFSGSTFSYTSQPTYTYRQYEQHQVNYLNTISETSAAIGDASEAMPLAGGKRIGRGQYLFTAAELSAAGLNAGPVTGLQLQVNTPGVDAGFLRIRMKGTALVALDPAAPEPDGWTEVYFLSTAFPAAGTQRFHYYQPFDWDGASNLLIDVSYTAADDAGHAVLAAHDAGFDAAIVSDLADYSLFFEGAGALPVPPASLGAISDAVTVSLWVKGTPDIMPVNSTVFEGKDDAGNRQLNAHLPWGNGQVYWDCGNDGGGYDRINKQADEADYEGRWNHWAFTKNAATGEMKIYLNGALWHSGAGKTKSIDLTSLHFGGAVTGNTAYFGAIDELRIWNAELDEASIRDWMRRPLDSGHPNYANLVAYFRLDENGGMTAVNSAPGAQDAAIAGAPGREPVRGRDLYKNFSAGHLRPDMTFLQGEYEVEDITVTVLDSVQNAPRQVIAYGLINGLPAAVDTFFVYQSGDMPVFDDLTGAQLAPVNVLAENSLDIGNLVYYNTFPAKFEILSLVTPYGNGLDLGSQGKVFTFDVSDYAPILRGKKRLSVEMGGENQEELDIQFLFIKGTPPQKVLNVQNVWPFRRGGFAAIQDNSVFEPRTVQTLPDGDRFKVRSSITGHGQNGEFVPRTHYLNLNDAPNEFEYEVWKKCGENPIFPQGGTWLFDRAGWCPGMATDVHELDITPYVTAGNPVDIDYGVLGDFMSDANYLVSCQLVTYGAPEHNLDAAVVDVIRPSQKVEHERFNPACTQPVVKIRNTGATPLTSLTFIYSLQGGQELSYSWTGDLAFMESEDVALPVNGPLFWVNGNNPQVFEVSIAGPNGMADEYPANNSMRAAFTKATEFSGETVLNYKTNSRGEENTMYIRDHEGNIVLERTVMDDNTVYTDALNMPPGCYTLEFLDTGDDGLYYWYWDAINLNVGSGYLRFRRKLNATAFITVKNFEPEFGSYVYFDFFIPGFVDAHEPAGTATLVGLRPNPATGQLTVDLVGFEGRDLSVALYDARGRLLQTQQMAQNPEQQLSLRFDLSAYPAGAYFVRIDDGIQVKTRTVMKQ